MRETVSSLLGMVASFLSASCCIAPTLFVVFGVSTGSLSFLNVLEPYRFYFLAMGYIAVGYSFYKSFLKKPNVDCVCEDRVKFHKLRKGLTLMAFVFLLVSTLYPYILAKIYGN
ncbi:MAG: mercuric transporter MerT family protein [Hydrogenobacter sp.]|uniref:mercuric transporter MerT family protein n=1 Tax=Hydrogenobacter thermophilus TaxID=940 RepID=UPI0030F5F6C3